jgi:hypothetical protein
MLFANFWLVLVNKEKPMSFTWHTLVVKDGTRRGLVRVYYDPAQDEPQAFAKALDEAISNARWTCVTDEDLYDEGLPSQVFLKVMHRNEDILTPAHEAALEAAGFSRETDGWTLVFPTSWDVDPRYRMLQERLEQRVDRSDPRERHDDQSSVSAYNMRVLMEAMQEAFGLALDGSFESIKQVDDFLIMPEQEGDWRFRVFTPATLIACGDYAVEVAIRTQPGVAWGDDEQHPLVIGRTENHAGMRTSTRTKARKRCAFGEADSLYSLLDVLIGMMQTGDLYKL